MLHELGKYQRGFTTDEESVVTGRKNLTHKERQTSLIGGNTLAPFLENILKETRRNSIYYLLGLCVLGINSEVHL